MALDCKTTTVVCVIACLSATVVVFGVLHVASGQQQKHDGNAAAAAAAAEPGKFAETSLKFVAVLFRHGDRAPAFKYKTDPHANKFPEGNSELTKKGKQHMYKKGQFFRRMYNGYINELYLDSEIVMKTTNVRRTYMSAAMVLAGMYPPRSYQKWSDSETVWQPIPIYHNSPDHGTLFNEQKKCPSLDLVLHDAYQSFNNANKNRTATLLLNLTEKCGQPITQPSELIMLYDLFICQIAEGLQLPEWAHPDLIESLKSVISSRENTIIIFKNTRLQNFAVGSLLKEIVSNIELRSINSNYNTTRKMHLYSGHDVSIAMIMGFLDNIITMPGFGASIHFHLYFNESSGYTIKIFFYNQWDNEKEEEISIPRCGNPCKMQDFIKFVEDNISNEWDECQKQKNEAYIS